MSQVASPAPRRTVRMVFSLLAFALAPVSYFVSIDNPALRASAGSVWLLLAAALFLGTTAAWRDRRVWVRGAFALELVLGALFVWSFFGLQRVPAGAPPERAPDFVLPDQDGRVVTLSSELARGPVLLVFYRGHW
jgi:hypothetical protein